MIVLDITLDPRWPADFKTDDPDEFLEVFWASRQCMAFIDEAGEAVGRYNDAMNKTATRGRHCGHVVHYCAQRATQIAPLVRDQCTGLFLFSSSARDGKTLAEEFGFDELETCNLLRTGEYFHATKMGACNRRSLFGGKNESGPADSRSDSHGSVASDGRQKEEGSGGGEGGQTSEVGEG